MVERRDTCGTQIVRGTVREESGEGSAARQDLFETGDTHASAASETVGIDGDANVSHGGLKTPSEAEDSPRIDTPQFLSDPVLARLADRLDQLQTSHRRALNEAVDTIAEAALPPGARARFRAWVATRVTRGEHLSGAYRMALDAAAYNASDTALATAKRRLDEGKLRTPEPSEAYRRIAGQRDALLDLERAIRETAEAIGQRRSLHECARAFRAALEQVTASGGLDARIEKRLRGVAEDDRVREVAGFRNRVTEWRWALEELSRTGADVDTSLIETAGRWSDVLAERIEVEQAAATERAEARRCEFDEMLRQMDEDHRQRGYEQFLADMAARLDFSGSVDTTTAVAVSPVETEPVDTATPEETTVTGAQPASEPDNFPTECPFGHTDLVMAGTPSGGWWPMCPQCLTAPVPADAATWESGA